MNYENIAVDRIPDPDEIGVGSIILFSQGGYRAGDTQLTGGKRWHQGKITKVYKDDNGTTLYDGHHTKGQSDGKHINYKNYCHIFTGVQRSGIRVGPNVFDLLQDTSHEGSNFTSGDIDIYFSHTKADHISEVNPNSMASSLKSKGLNLINSNDTGLKISNKVEMMRNSKVFVACISDDYVQDESCRMEFQFAKSTLGKPVVPLVIGGGMEWQLSVVGSALIIMVS